jgi:hypothetical protein
MSVITSGSGGGPSSFASDVELEVSGSNDDVVEVSDPVVGGMPVVVSPAVAVVEDVSSLPAGELLCDAHATSATQDTTSGTSFIAAR